MNNQTAQEALDRARNGDSTANYSAIYEGFARMGIAEKDIRPRENVLTFNAWKAMGRHVRRGEHGVKVVTWIERDEEIDGVMQRQRYPRSATVFHISQTDLNQ